MINSICVVRLSALGDVLMLVPLIRTLQVNLPKTTITWIISPPAYDLVAGMDGVEFIVIDKPRTWMSYWQFKKTLNGRQFDVLLATQASMRANLLYPFILAKRKIGYDSLRAKDGHGWFINETIKPGHDHTLDGFLKFADVLGLSEKKIAWNLPITDADQCWACHYSAQKKILIVNPAASKPERSWLVERYIAVIKIAIKKWQLTVILTGGPSRYDRELADAIVKQVPVCIDLVGKTKPKQLLALISQAQVLLCPDTGPAHMAAAVGTPVVALHAVTSANVSGPYLYRHLAVDCYSKAVINILKKDKRTNTWGTHAHGPKTMHLISVKAVLKKLRLVLLNTVVTRRG
jgi:heptosyltransferase I